MWSSRRVFPSNAVIAMSHAKGIPVGQLSRMRLRETPTEKLRHRDRALPKDVKVKRKERMSLWGKGEVKHDESGSPWDVVEHRP